MTDLDQLTRPDGIVPVNIETTAGLVREVLRLRKGIQDYLDGNAGQTVRKNEQCVHGRYGYEGCENCTDEHFAAVLSPPRDK